MCCDIVTALLPWKRLKSTINFITVSTVYLCSDSHKRNQRGNKTFICSFQSL